LGVASLLRQTRLDLSQKEYVNTMEQCAETLLGLTNDFLDLAKIEQAGKEAFTVHYNDFSPVGVIETSVAIASYRLENSDVYLTTSREREGWKEREKRERERERERESKREREEATEQDHLRGKEKLRDRERDTHTHTHTHTHTREKRERDMKKQRERERERERENKID